MDFLETRLWITSGLSTIQSRTRFSGACTMTQARPSTSVIT